jgi:Uma2 family endonuclease
MATVVLEERVTPEDLLAMPSEINYELVNGELVKRNMGAESSWIASNLIWLFGSIYGRKKPGHLFTTDCGYQCFPDDPDKVRRPDVSFVRKGRFPGERVPRGYIRIAPDLVVEVMSPNDLASEISVKVEEYLDAGVPLVWVISPDAETVIIHRVDGSVTKLHLKDELRGEDILPEFCCRVSDLFVDVEEEPIIG